MKNLFRLLTCALLLGGFAACSDSDEPKNEGPVDPTEPTQLSNPKLREGETTADSFQVTWEAIEHAASYAYTVNGGEQQTTAEPEIRQTGLSADTEFVVRVKAVSGDAEHYTDSEWSDITLRTLEEKNDKPTPDEPFLVEVPAETLKAISAVINVYPQDKEAYYYYSIEKLTSWNAQTAAERQADLIEYFTIFGQFVMQIPFPDCLTEMLFSGDGSALFTNRNGIEPLTEYVAYAIGMDLTGKFTTDYYTVNFTTPSGGVSPLSASISFSEITGTSMKITVTPDKDVLFYYETLVNTQDMEDYIAKNGEEAFQEVVRKKGERVEGTDSYTWEPLDPDTDYTMAVVGFDKNGAMFYTTASQKTAAGDAPSSLRVKGEGLNLIHRAAEGNRMDRFQNPHFVR